MDPVTTLPAASASARAKLKDESNTQPRKIRSACDRCHSQKLRCIRKQGEVSCARCIKLHTSCRFGPRAPRASLKPPQHGAPGDWHRSPSVSAAIPMPNVHSNPAMTDSSCSEWLFSSDVDAGIAEEQVGTMHSNLCYPMPGDSSDTHNFWPDLSCEPGNSNLLDQYGSTDLDLVSQDQFRDAFPLPETFDDHPRVSNDDRLATSPASNIRDLANLNIALYDCAAELPSMSKASMKTTGIASRERSSQKRTPFIIDELFRLTSEFIDVIRYISREAGDTSTILSTKDSTPWSAHALSLAAHNQQLSYAGVGVTGTGSGRPFSHVDEGTMLMIMSCHCRLIEIYLSIFQMMQACIEYSIAPQKEKDWAIVLPRLQVGAHAAPPMQVDANTALPSATTSMYMLMITMFSSQLCEKLADVMGAGYGEISGGGGGVHLQGQRVGVRDESPVSPSQYFFTATVTDRTDRLERTIDVTKHLLQRFSLVAE